MIKEIKFTDKALKQIDNLLSKKTKVHSSESLLKVEDVLVFNMNSLLKTQDKMMI